MKVSIVYTDAATISSHSFCGFSNPAAMGHRRKCDWLCKRFTEGLRFKILQVDGEDVGMIEYVPGEYAWRPIEADGYMVIHCIMVQKKKYKGKGYGKLLLDECVRDARQAGMQGVAVVTSGGTWMADERLFRESGFECVDTAVPSFKLLVNKFRDAAKPRFKRDWDQTLRKYGSGLTIITSDQCPCIVKALDDILKACAELGLAVNVVDMQNSREARMAPSAYGVFNVIYNGKVVAEHPISATRFRNIMRKLGVS